MSQEVFPAVMSARNLEPMSTSPGHGSLLKSRIYDFVNTASKSPKNSQKAFCATSLFNEAIFSLKVVGKATVFVVVCLFFAKTAQAFIRK